MPFKFAERVKETTSNKPADAGTAFNLGGARTGFRTFVAGIGDGVKCVYLAQEVDGSGNPAGAWEVAIGEVDDASPDTLSRGRLIASSTGSFIDWSATGENSSPDVMCVLGAGLGSSGFGPINFVGANVFYGPISSPATWTSSGANAGQFYAAPFFVPRPLVIDQMRAHCNGGNTAGANARLGVYKQVGAASEAMPRILDAGEIDLSTTGIKTLTSLDTLIDAGTYWAGIHFESSTPTFMGSGASGASSGLSVAVLGHNSSSELTNAAGVAGLSVDLGGYGALPSTVTFTGTRSTNFPLCQIKFAEP